jgi:AcrR family transcriptional regulator
MTRSLKAREAPTSRAAIIDAAERLFGRHGLDGVSFRQIVAEAGSLNNFAVQYHFGDRAGLVRAIFERRLPVIELRRAEMLSAAKRGGALEDVKSLVEIIFRPIAEQRDAAGQPTYAAFLLALDNAGDDFRTWMQLIDLAPVAEHVADRLAAAVPHVPAPLFAHRMKAITISFIVSVLRRDRAPELPEALVVDDALAVAAAAIGAPVSERLATALSASEVSQMP